MSVLEQIALMQVPGIGSVTAHALLNHFGHEEAIFKSSLKELLSVKGINRKIAEAIFSKASFSKAERECVLLEKSDVKVLFYLDKLFPKRLKQCYDSPILLYYRSKADFNANKILSIVGTRSATSYGKGICEKLVEDLKPYSLLIVSGLAYGIDSIVHRACLAQKIPTVGVLGHGLKYMYPAAHCALAEKMQEEGGILSEFSYEVKPERANFPKRNKIIAGMADATIVIEAHMNGGALITAELANSYNRRVFAFPGDIDSIYSTGCNFLIKSGKAKLISSASDVAHFMGWEALSKEQAPKQISLDLGLDADEKLIVEVLTSKGSLCMDELAMSTNLPLSKLSIAILNLEMQGLVLSSPGKMYQLTGH